MHKVEHKIYPKAIALFVDGRLKITGRRVKVLDKPAAYPAASDPNIKENAGPGEAQ
ncbi:MAG: hypothetical protein HY210_05940 [Candidatus Omnitrophica bacterium]|nr:hypothetical protein [Candidatus Omnitrophota bacterium]